jgi:2-polyprenyl-3-methyl-5-hydroxy-6-metoxy-1,4-benzoquinol methylase
MTTPQIHPMMPARNHNEHAQASFVMSFKDYIQRQLDPLDRELTEKIAVPEFEQQSGRAAASSKDVRKIMEAEPFHQFWLSAMRHQQDLMWDVVAGSVDRQLDELQEKARAQSNPTGSLRLNPDLEIPDYLTSFDNHRMPGSYYTEVSDDDDLRAGALFDGAAALYHLNRNGGGMNDARGWTLLDHIAMRFPDFSKPKRVLDIGSCVGNSTHTYCDKWPNAEVHGIDIGAPLIRYAHARSESLDKTVHYSQQNAEQTDFDDGYFDLIVSTAMLHETNKPGLQRIFEECRRLLRPGGVMAHLEVPVRYEHIGIWPQIRADWEAQVNNEPFMTGIARMDLSAAAETAGFNDVAAGYHWQVPGFIPGKKGFQTEGDPNGNLMMGSWYMISGSC